MGADYVMERQDRSRICREPDLGIGFVLAYFMLIAVDSRSHQASEFFQFILPCIAAIVLGTAGLRYRYKARTGMKQPR